MPYLQARQHRLGDIFSDIETGLSTASSVANDVQGAVGGGSSYSSPSVVYAAQPAVAGISPTTLLLLGLVAVGGFTLWSKKR